MMRNAEVLLLSGEESCTDGNWGVNLDVLFAAAIWRGVSTPVGWKNREEEVWPQYHRLLFFLQIINTIYVY